MARRWPSFAVPWFYVFSSVCATKLCTKLFFIRRKAAIATRPYVHAYAPLQVVALKAQRRHKCVVVWLSNESTPYVLLCPTVWYILEYTERMLKGEKKRANAHLSRPRRLHAQSRCLSYYALCPAMMWCCTILHVIKAHRRLIDDLTHPPAPRRAARG